MSASPTIIWTHTDEAPALATYSFLPIVRAFTAGTDLQLDVSDISLAARILAVFSDRLDESQRVPDALAQLGELTSDPGQIGTLLRLQRGGGASQHFDGSVGTDVGRMPPLLLKGQCDQHGGQDVGILRERGTGRRETGTVQAHGL